VNGIWFSCCYRNNYLRISIIYLVIITSGFSSTIFKRKYYSFKPKNKRFLFSFKYVPTISNESHLIHSIFVLRLFNNKMAILFYYASIACILKKWWRLGCILFRRNRAKIMN
jgi:hypothetical protein